MKVFRPYDPEQILLMPAALQEWLPADHLAYFISDVVDHLDLSAIMSRYEGEERGYPPYNPWMLVKVLVYAYCTGVPSSRKIEKHLKEDIAFRVLAANNTPDFPDHLGFSQGPLEGAGRTFSAGVKAVPKSRIGKAGTRVFGWDEDKGQCITAQSYELQKDEGRRSSFGGRDHRAAAQS
jgi:transposase